MDERADLLARIRELEHELEQSTRLDAEAYRTVVQDMSELVVRWDPDGTRRFVNEAYARLFGTERQDLIGTSFWPLVSERDRARVMQRIAALTPKSPVSTGRHRATGPDGEFWMEWVDRAVYDRDGGLIGYLSVGRDITERVRLDEKGRELARVEAIARTSAAVAHDLRNVLVVLMEQSSALGEAVGDRPELRVLEQGISKAREILERLDRSRYGNAPLVLQIVADEAVEDLAPLVEGVAGPDVAVELDLGAPGCEVLVDCTALDQALLNLARNACEAMKGVGKLRVSTRASVVADMGVDLMPPLASTTSCVLLSVSDTGPGIASGVRDRLFAVGATTNGEGRGLGLATVKAFAESHHGAVGVTSSPHGATFSIALPTL